MERKRMYVWKKMVSILSVFFLAGIVKSAMISSAKISSSELQPGKIVMISYQINKPIDITIQVFNKNDKCIRTIISKYQNSIKGEIPWNGKDNSGKIVPAGTYFIKIEAGLTASLDKSFGNNGFLDNFTSPYDVTVDSNGYIYLLDKGDSYLYKFDQNGKSVKDFGKNGRISTPGGQQAVKVGSKGNIYITATWPQHQVWKYDKNGTFIYGIGGFFDWKGGRFGCPTTAFPIGIGLSNNGRMYIIQSGFEGIVVYNRNFEGTKGFLYRSKWQYLAPNPPYGYCGPGITATPNRGIYALNNGSTLYKAIDKNKDVTPVYSINVASDGIPLRNPTGVCYDNQGGVYVADWGNGRIVKFYDDGVEFKPVCTFGQFGQGKLKEGFLLNPHAVAISPDGKSLYIAEDGEPVWDYKTNTKIAFPGNHRLSKWNLKYTETKIFEIKVVK